MSRHRDLMTDSPWPVLADGCFDPFHVGHLWYLMTAADIGRLYVNIAPDLAIMAKGRKVYQIAEERARTIKALRCVHEVFVGELEESVRLLRPKFLVKGSEWAGCLPESVLAACREVDTMILFTCTPGRTSTERLAG